MRSRARWRNWPHQSMRWKICWRFTKSRSSHQVRWVSTMSFGTTWMPQPRKLTEGLRVLIKDSFTSHPWVHDSKLGENILRPREAHYEFTLTFCWCSIISIQLGMGHPLSPDGQDSEPPGMQTEWLETKRVNTQHSVRIVVETRYFGGPPSVAFAHIFGVRSSSKNWHPSSISILPTTLLKQANKMILQNHVWKLIALFLNIFDVFYSMTIKLLLTLMTLMMQCCCQNCFPCLWYILYLFLCRAFSHFAMVSTLVLCCFCSASLSVCCLSFCWILSLSL